MPSRRRHFPTVLLVVALLLAACKSSTREAPASPPPAQSPSPTVTGPPPNPLKSVKQGGTYWAVYVVVTNRPDEPETKLAESLLKSLHISRYSEGQIRCDRGAAEALGVPENSYTVAVYFKSQADAEAFSAALAPTGEGVAQVRTFCAD